MSVRSSPFFGYWLLTIGYLTDVYLARSWIDCRRDHDSDPSPCDRFSLSAPRNTKFQNQIDPLCRPFERTLGTPLEGL